MVLFPPSDFIHNIYKGKRSDSVAELGNAFMLRPAKDRQVSSGFFPCRCDKGPDKDNGRKKVYSGSQFNVMVGN